MIQIYQSVNQKVPKYNQDVIPKWLKHDTCVTKVLHKHNPEITKNMTSCSKTRTQTRSHTIWWKPKTGKYLGSLIQVKKVKIGTRERNGRILKTEPKREAWTGQIIPRTWCQRDPSPRPQGSTQGPKWLVIWDMIVSVKSGGRFGPIYPKSNRTSVG